MSEQHGRSYTAEDAQVVGEVLFVEVRGGVVTIDVAARAVRHPSGASLPGSPFALTLRLPEDDSLGVLLVDRLHRWAEEGAAVGLDFVAGPRAAVRIASAGTSVRLALASPAAPDV